MNEFTDRPPEPDVEKMNFKKGSPVKAITIGVVVDIGGSLVLGIILVMIYSVLLASEGLSPEEIEYQLINLDPHSTFSFNIFDNKYNYWRLGECFCGLFVCKHRQLLGVQVYVHFRFHFSGIWLNGR
jgi:hypothetical protein